MNNIITDTIEFLFELRRKPVVEINGRNYLNTANGVKEVDEPGFPALQGINSLDGLVAYLKSDIDKPDVIKRVLFIIIEKYWEVSVVTAPYGDFLKRDLITDCNHMSLYSLDGKENGTIQPFVGHILPEPACRTLQGELRGPGQRQACSNY